MRLLDRYILNCFLIPFLYCFFGFVGIWLVFDLSDNGPDFIAARISPIKVAGFYLTQLPQFAVIALPVGLLLALLYTLSRMSRSNEIISMLTAGRSIVRIITPLVGVGLLIALVAMGLNYELAPRSEAIKKDLLDQMLRGRTGRDFKGGILFRNRSNNRTWFVQRLSLKRNAMDGVLVIEQDPQGNIVRKTYGKRAWFDDATGRWTFERGRTVDFKPDGDVEKDALWIEEQRVMADWNESPKRIAAANLDPQLMTVPELENYLRWNADFPPFQLAPYSSLRHYRLAFPWGCLIVVFIASPLGIVFSRRGVLAGVTWSIAIFFAMVFLTNLFLALGKGARVPAWLAGWGPNLIFAVIGFLILWMKSNNMSFADLFMPRHAKPTERSEPLPSDSF
jgi:LPS export ABC transporter permease LptG